MLGATIWTEPSWFVKAARSRRFLRQTPRNNFFRGLLIIRIPSLRMSNLSAVISGDGYHRDVYQVQKDPWEPSSFR